MDSSHWRVVTLTALMLCVWKPVHSSRFSRSSTEQLSIDARSHDYMFKVLHPIINIRISSGNSLPFLVQISKNTYFTFIHTAAVCFCFFLLLNRGRLYPGSSFRVKPIWMRNGSMTPDHDGLIYAGVPLSCRVPPRGTRDSRKVTCNVSHRLTWSIKEVRFLSSQ